MRVANESSSTAVATFILCVLPKKSTPEDDAINIYIQPSSKQKIAWRQYISLALWVPFHEYHWVSVY